MVVFSIFRRKPQVDQPPDKPDKMNLAAAGFEEAVHSSFGNRRQLRKSPLGAASAACEQNEQDCSTE
jgi:hypothetical protein